MPTPASDVPAKPGDDRPVAHLSFRDEQCGDCGGEVREGDLYLYEADRIVCLSCAGLDRLIFLPSGKVALTRRRLLFPRIQPLDRPHPERPPRLRRERGNRGWDFVFAGAVRGALRDHSLAFEKFQE